ncbi:YbjQ family protein [Patescibacteria group bacterium]|nr:YbjQ family protein [Patescibacteria group bacterium]
MIIVSSNQIVGKEVKETLGLVRGNTIRAKHIGKDILAGLRSIVGGEISEYTEALDEARDIALKRMTEEAEKLGADAILDVRFTTSQVMAGAAELLVYGTAVKIG